MLVVVAAVAVTPLSRPAWCYSDAVYVDFPLYTESWTPEQQNKVLDFSSPFHSHYSLLPDPFAHSLLQHTSPIIAMIFQICRAHTHMLYFSSRWSKATVLSKMRREKSDLILHTHIHIYTLTQTELDAKAFALVEPFIWSFFMVLVQVHCMPKVEAKIHSVRTPSSSHYRPTSSNCCRVYACVRACVLH